MKFKRRNRGASSGIGLSVLPLAFLPGIAAGTASAQPIPSYGHEFVTVNHRGNAPWVGVAPSGSALLSGRGSVDHDYRIAKFEITTAQWMEFVNTYTTMGGSYTLFGNPLRWGAVNDPTYNGPGERWRLSTRPNAADLPVGGITWRYAAQYANWLHNDKAPTIAAIQTGAYDTSTWGWVQATNHYTDGDRLPGAKFWIPTLDELMKATHYDPDRNGPGESGWWSYKSMSDAPAIPGLPGVGETSAYEQSYGPLGTGGGIPVGSYLGYESPWGLMDTSGAGNEWTEEWSTPEYWPVGLHSARLLLGAAISGPPIFLYDHVGEAATDRPDARPPWGSFRLASAVPAPHTFFVLLTPLALNRRKR